MRILLIDDARDFGADIVARNGTEAINIIRFLGHFDLILLDHDLGPGPTGYDVAIYLEQNKQLLPDRLELVTSNPAGRQRMAQVFEKLFPHNLKGILFSKYPFGEPR